MKKKYTMLFKTLALFVVLSVLLQPTFLSAAAKNQNSHADVSLEPGELEFTSVPNMTFSENAKSAKGSSIFYAPGKIDGVFTIEDARGSEAGWNISVSLGHFRRANPAQADRYSLYGASLSLEKPEIKSLNTNAKALVGYPVELIEGDGIFHKYVIAPKGTQGGIWEGKVPAAELTVDSDTITVGTHLATLYWSLEDTP